MLLGSVWEARGLVWHVLAQPQAESQIWPGGVSGLGFVGGGSACLGLRNIPTAAQQSRWASSPLGAFFTSLASKEEPERSDEAMAPLSVGPGLDAGALPLSGGWETQTLAPRQT